MALVLTGSDILGEEKGGEKGSLVKRGETILGDGRSNFTNPERKRKPYENPAIIRELNETGDIEQSLRLSGGDLHFSMRNALGYDSDKIAGIIKLSKQTGIPEQQISDNPREAKQFQEIKAALAKLTSIGSDLQPKYPLTMTLLTSSQNAILARGDENILAEMEDITRRYRQEDQNFIVKAASHVTANIASRMLKPIALVPTLIGSAANLAFENAGLVPLLPIPLDTFVTKELDRFSKNLAAVATEKSIFDQLHEGKIADAVENTALQVLGALPLIASMLVSSAAGVSQARILTSLGAIVAAESNVEALKRGKAPQNSFTAAILKGVAEGFFESFSLGLIQGFGRIAAKKFGVEGGKEFMSRVGKNVTKAFAIESTSESLTTGVQDVVDVLVLGDEITLATAGKRMFDSAVVGGVVGTNIAIAHEIAAFVSKASKLRKDKEIFDGMVARLQNSQLNERSPDVMGEHIDNLVGESKNVTLPVEKFTTFFQDSPDDILEAAKRLGIEEQLKEAQDTGVELQIKKSRLMNEPELYQAVQNDVRFTEGGITENERKDANEITAENLNRISQEYKDAAEEAKPPKQLTDMRDKLILPKNKGGFGLSAENASAQIDVFMAGAEVLSRKTGETKREWFNRVNPVLQIGGSKVDIGLAQGKKKAPRGAITFTDSSTIISLFEKADRSTFLHETFHLFNNELTKVIDKGLADEQTRKDFEALKEFADGDIAKPLSTKGEEKLARAFESYLKTGKSPSVKLANAFRKFKSWLSNIYGAVRGNGITRNPELSDIFDRMLASEKEINEVQEYYRAIGVIDALFPKDKKVEKADIEPKKDLEEKAEEARQESIEKQTKKNLNAFLRSPGEVDKIRERATKEIEDTPVYAALAEIEKSGGIVESDLAPFMSLEDIESTGKKHKGLLQKEKKVKKEKTFSGLVLSYGGVKSSTIEPAVRKTLRENGVRNIYRKDGRGLDVIAQEMQADNVLFVPEGRNADDHLLQLLIDKEVVPIDGFDVEEQLEPVNLLGIAFAFDYDTPEHLINQIREAQGKKEAIDGRVKGIVEETEAEIRQEVSKDEPVPGEDSYHSDARIKYLIAQAQILEERAKRNKKSAEARRIKKLELKVFKDAAEIAIGGKSVRDASRQDRFARAEQRFAVAAVRAAEKGDYVLAHENLRLQIVNHAMVQAAIKAKEERIKIEESYKTNKLKNTLDSKTAGVENSYAEVVLSLVNMSGLNTKLTPKNPDSVADIASLDEVIASHAPSWILEGVLPGVAKDYKDISMDDLRELDSIIKMIIAAGKGELKSLKAAGFETVDSFVNASVERMEQLKDASVFDATTVRGKAMSQIRNLSASLTKFEFLGDALDNYSFIKDKILGPIGQLFNRGLEANSDKQTIVLDVFNKLLPNLDVLGKAMNDAKKQFGENINVEGVPIPEALQKVGRFGFSPDNIVAMALNMGNAHNADVMARYFEYTPEQFNRLLSTVIKTKKQAQAIQGVWDAIETMFPALDATFFRRYNRHLKKTEARSLDITLENGETIALKGGYYPLQFDHILSDKAANIRELDILKNETAGVLRTGKLIDSFANARKAGHSLPPLLRLSVLTKHIDDVSMYISHAEYLADFTRIINNKKWKETFKDKTGRKTDITPAQQRAGKKSNTDQYSELVKLVKEIARPDKGPNDWFNNFLAHQKNAATLYMLGANFTVGIKQRGSLLPAVTELGMGSLIKGFKTAGLLGVALPTEQNRLHQFVIEKDKVMRDRAKNHDREITDLVGKLDPFVKKFEIAGKEFTHKDIKTFMFYWIRMNDRATVNLVWVSAYNKSLEISRRRGATPEKSEIDAIVFARAVVSRTQPTNTTINLNSLQRNKTGVMRMFTSFMTFQFVQQNRFFFYARAYKDGAVTTNQYIRHIMYEAVGQGWMMLSITAALGSGEFPEWWEFAMAPFETATMGIPLLRNIPGTFKYGRPVGESPAFRGIELATKAGKDTWEYMQGDKEFNEALWAIARATEFQLGVPAFKVMSNMRRTYDRINGENKRRR